MIMDPSKDEAHESHVEKLEQDATSIEAWAEDNAAAAATHKEHELTFRQAIRYYRPAVMWSIIVSMAVIMESYDIQIIASFYAFPSFQKKYGVPLGHAGKYSVPAKWQLGLNLGTLVGLLIGSYSNGYLTERFGPKRVFMACHACLCGLIFITFFAPNIKVLLVGEILCGLPWGVFSTLAPAYAAEVCPLVLRSYLTTYVNLCWVMGHILGTGVLKGLLSLNSQWGYRIPFAIQWVWPPLLLIAICFAPQSPWWLVRQGRMEEAEATMKRLVNAPEEIISIKNTVAMMAHTIQVEKEMKIGTSYFELFKGHNRRRTEIASVTWLSQTLVGFAIQGYITYFFTQAGLATSDAFKLSLGNFSIAFVGTTSSWYFMAKFGRRSMYLAGLSAMIPIMLMVGFLDFGHNHSSVRWAQCTILLVWFLLYGLTIGPLPYAIASEVGASRLRFKTISFARSIYYVVSIVNVVASPYMLNPTEANLRGKAAFPAAGFSMLLFVWAWFRLPETKGRTFEELDILFEREVPTREFKRYQIPSL